MTRPVRLLVAALTAWCAVAACALAYADGIDVSHWQGTVDWKKVDGDGVTFAFMKATEGSYYTDPTLHTNWRGAEARGIYRAAYHFARPSKGSSEVQARYFVSRAGTFGDPGDLPPVLDLEVTGGLSPKALRTWTRNWLTTVERLTGRRPLIYFSPYFWIDHLGNSTAFARYPLWIAHYTTGSPMVPGGWSTWTFWQRTSSGHVAGIAGNVDLNRFHGTRRQLAALAHASGGSDDPVEPGPTLPGGVATAVTLSASTSTPAIGQRVAFTGALTTPRPTGAVAGRTVSLWRRPPGSATWTSAGSATTGSDGGFAVRSRVTATADYQVRFAADGSFAAAVSPVRRLTTPARAPTTIDLRAEPPTVERGAALMVYGHLLAAGEGLAGQRVRYYKRTVHGTRWVYVGRSQSLAPTGWHSLTVHPKIAREWKVVYRGTARNTPATSRLLTVRPR